MRVHLSNAIKVITLTVAVILTSAGIAATASAAAKKSTITCYKGTIVKSITALSPKCPAGFTTKKPTASPTAKPSTSSTSAATIAFSATYKGSIAMMWSDSDVMVTNLTGTGSGTDIGDSKLTGTGGSSPSAQCDPINGTGSISGSAGVLNVKLDTDAQGCAQDGSAPTTVDVKGSAVITGGTGKYLGASGKLAIVGSFGVKSTTAGSSEKDDFKVTLTGTITLKR